MWLEVNNPHHETPETTSTPMPTYRRKPENIPTNCLCTSSSACFCFPKAFPHPLRIPLSATFLQLDGGWWLLGKQSSLHGVLPNLFPIHLPMALSNAPYQRRTWLAAPSITESWHTHSQCHHPSWTSITTTTPLSRSPQCEKVFPVFRLFSFISLNFCPGFLIVH